MRSRAAHGAAEPLAPAAQDSPDSLTSNLNQRTHAAPRSTHSEAAFTWKAGASQHAARNRAAERVDTSNLAVIYFGNSNSKTRSTGPCGGPGTEQRTRACRPASPAGRAAPTALPSLLPNTSSSRDAFYVLQPHPMTPGMMPDL